MSNLNRFQISASSLKRNADEIPVKTKSLAEVKEFNSSGVFFLTAKACPMRAPGGIPCKRKLDEENYCSTCAHRAKKPLYNLYLRMDLLDCEDAEISQQTTAFSAAAEHFLGLKIDQFVTLADTRPEKLEALLQSKIDKTVAVRLNLKEAKGEHDLLDWIITSIVEQQEQEKDEKSDGDSNDSPVTEAGSTKRAKKN